MWAGFVVVLIADEVHQVELVDQAALLEQFEGAVDGDAVELGVALVGQVVERFGVQVFARGLDQIEQKLALAGQPDAAVAEGLAGGVGLHALRRLYTRMRTGRMARPNIMSSAGAGVR